MKEIELSELETWYMKKLKDRFKKEHKVLEKFFQMAERELAEAKAALNNWLGSMGKPKPGITDQGLDEKSMKIMERFIQTIVEALGNVKIPTVHAEISYDSSQKYCEDIKKLYITYNETGRKSIARFSKQFMTEIKEIDMHLRKIGDLTNKVGEFLRKNYQDAKNAELQLKRIPRLQSDIERLGQSKVKIGESETELVGMKENLKRMEDTLFELSKDPDLQELEKIENTEQLKSNYLRDSLRFKKAFQKLKNLLEKGIINARGLTENDLRPYLKDPVLTIIEEGPKTANLRQALIKTRLILEDDSDPLQLKSDIRAKIQENIDNIVNKNELEPLVQELVELKQSKETLRKKLEEKGLESQRRDLKDRIALLTVDLEHFENDLNRRKREYRELLEKVSTDRNELQKIIEKETSESIKLHVIIPT
jgi:hypothetical protein